LDRKQSRLEQERYRNLMIPVVDGAFAQEFDFLDVSVEAGRYLVQVNLPSGDLLSQEVAVAADAKSTTVRFSDHTSAHEWLSWQNFAGNVETRTLYDAAEAAVRSSEPLLVRSSKRFFNTTSAAGMEGVSTTEGPPAYWISDPNPVLTQPSGHSAWELLADHVAAHPGTRYLPLNGNWGYVAQANQYDSLNRLYLCTSAGPFLGATAPLVNYYGKDSTDLVRRKFFVADAEGEAEIVSVPVPWFNAERGVEVPVEILVPNSRTLRQFPTAVTVRDPSLGGALAYMTAGALPNAAKFFDQAMSMLLEKVRNPIAAAAGGYVLLATHDGRNGRHWYQWIENLMNWFEWLPDGPIQYAWLKLRFQRSDESMVLARKALALGFQRGLPFYSAGVSWLLDGLTLFEQESEEAAKMADAVRRVALRTNMSQPFTTIRFGTANRHDPGLPD
jgi:hypothetical protein